MLKSTEFAELKVGQVLGEMQEATGLTVDQLQLLDQVKAKAAMSRLKDLGIPQPLPTKTSDIRLLQPGVCGGSYSCVRRLPGKGMGQNAMIRLTVMTSIAIESDEKLWYHASITRGDGKMPTYEDLCWLRENFFQDRWAFQYFPPKDQHISHHDKCLHLWSCLEEYEIPDFRKFGSI